MDTRVIANLKDYGLVADVGGTNIRFGLVDLQNAGGAHILAPHSLRLAHYANMVEAARAYLKELHLGAPPTAAVFGIAGPVYDGVISLTNSDGKLSTGELRNALGADRVQLINDYEAIAHAIPFLKPEDLFEIGHASPSDSGLHERETVAILGPGTGLGVAGFVRTKDGVVPLVTEGGHVGFAPANDIEIEILRFLMKKFGRVSVERILSGPGMCNLYEALSEVEGSKTEEIAAEQITFEARRDPASLCARVFETFCAILGSLAGDVALSMGARDGVMLAGGILPDMKDLLAKSAFRSRFEAKGRFMGYMKQIPTHLIVQSHVGLIGAAALVEPGAAGAARKRAFGNG